MVSNSQLEAFALALWVDSMLKYTNRHVHVYIPPSLQLDRKMIPHSLLYYYAS